MDNISLCKLIREALHSPEKAEALALAIDHLPEVKRYLGKKWLPYYDQAIKATMRSIKRDINKFPQIKRLNLETIDCRNPDEIANLREKFISWVMMILKRDCIDVIRGLKNIVVISLSQPIGEGWEIEDNIADRQNLNTVEVLVAKEKLQENRQKEEELRCLIKSFVCHPSGYPICTCYELIQRRLLREPPQTWKLIAIELEIPFGTVTAHWNRKCQERLNKISA